MIEEDMYNNQDTWYKMLGTYSSTPTCV